MSESIPSGSLDTPSGSSGIPSEIIETVFTKPMETSRSIYWFGATLGGFTLAAVSAVVMWVAEKKIPNNKTIGRDVLLGVILFFLLLQLLPESTTALVTAIMSVFTFSHITVPTGGSVIDTISTVITADEMEVRVGVPRF